MATCVVGRGPWRWPVGACVFSPKASPSTHALAARRRNMVLCPGPLPWPTHTGQQLDLVVSDILWCWGGDLKRDCTSGAWEEGSLGHTTWGFSS